MTAIEQMLASVLLSMSWQALILVGICELFPVFVPGSPARLRFIGSMSALALTVLLPFGAIFGLWSNATVSSQVSEPSPAVLLVIRWFVWIAVILTMVRALKLLFAIRPTNRLRAGAIEVDTACLSLLPESWRDNRRAKRTRVFMLPASTEASGPLTTGVFAPAILLPHCLFQEGNERLVRAALIHEFAHVRRNDALWLAVSELMLVPLAFHPVSALFRRRLQLTREMACDELVASEVLPARDYAQDLLDVARHVTASPSGVVALGVFSGGSLEARIRALANFSRFRDKHLSRWQKATLALAAAGIIAVLIAGARFTLVWMSPDPGPPKMIYSIVPKPPPPPPPPPGLRRN
ncbi:MAG: M56 family metallopeptidase [Bryobacteraceae bacterium]